MFRKPFRVKSNVAVKSSERRNLRAEVARRFSSVTEAFLDELLPKDEDVHALRLVLHNDETCCVYSTRGLPVFFERASKSGERNIFPTVYTLWKNPDIMNRFVTSPFVLTKLQGGADLMFPGVINIDELGDFSKGQVVAVSLFGNRAPVGVGVTALSSDEVARNGLTGKGVLMHHVYEDFLWELGNRDILPLIPHDAKNESVAEEVEGEDEDDDQPVAAATVTEEPEMETSRQTLPDVDDMDSLLVWCLLCALKKCIRKDELPLLTSTFYRKHMQSCCPHGASLDVKKSKYKKISNLLKDVEDQGLLSVSEQSKGVDAIVSVNWKHSLIKSFSVPSQNAAESSELVKKESVGPLVEELWMPSSATLPLFKSSGLAKGSTLTVAEVRKVVTDYVRSNDLVQPNNKSFIVLDPILSDAVAVRGTPHAQRLRWDEVMQRIVQKMSPCHRITLCGRTPVLRKGAVEKISVSTATRTGNKKVTLIRGLELFGVDLREFSQVMQKKAASSTSVGERADSKGAEVLVQGTFVKQVCALLADRYNIPSKWIEIKDKPAKKSK